MNYNDLLRYINAALAGYEYEIDRAIEEIDHYRCPLSSASDKIVSLMDDAIRDYCDDNDIDYYNFDYSYYLFELQYIILQFPRNPV